MGFGSRLFTALATIFLKHINQNKDNKEVHLIRSSTCLSYSWFYGSYSGFIIPAVMRGHSLQVLLCIRLFYTGNYDPRVRFVFTHFGVFTSCCARGRSRYREHPKFDVWQASHVKVILQIHIYFYSY